MKGFRKLFLGLIFLTLIGVGFKVDVKAAAATAQASLQVPSTWATGTKMPMRFSGDYPDVKNNGENATFTYIVQITDGGTHALTGESGSSVKIVLKSDKDTSGNQTYTYSINDGAFQAGGTTGTSDILLNEYTSNQVRGFVESYGTESDSGKTKTVTFAATTTAAPEPTGNATNNQIGVVSLRSSASSSIHMVTLAAKDPKNNDIPDAKVGYDPSKTFFLIEGESKKVTVNKDIEVYTIDDWSDTFGRVNSRTITMGTSPVDLTAIYMLDPKALYIPTLKGKVAAGTETKHFPIAEKKYTVSDCENATATLGGSPIPFNSDGTYVSFIPKKTMEGTMPLVITMPDGNQFSYTVDVVNVSNVGIAFEKEVYTLGTKTTVKLILKATGGTPPDDVDYSVVSGTGLTINKEEISGVTVITGDSSASNIKIEAVATYTGDITIPQKTASTIVNIQSLKMKDDLFVNKGQTVYLGDFISSGSKDMTVSSITNNADSYIELSGGAGSKLKDISVKGKTKVAALDKEKFVVDGNQMKVTVYPEPTLSVETTSGSSSSGSYTYSYNVTMPKGVYYGDDTSVWVSDLKKAILIFKGSGDDGKTKEVVLEDLKEDEKNLTNKQSKKIDVKTLTGYLRDIGKKDEETISVYACAVNGKGNNDDKIKTETKEIKAYKISLDTNGGKTSYTVNGDSVSDFFYKIDGVEYTVVARGTGTLDKKNSVNADNATTSSGMATIVLGPSGAGVAGERRIKAAFSSSGSGGTDGTDGTGGDDYDDVPKTGESKADIWILWSVLFIAILGAGFMIWKRFGLVRAIAEAEHQEAVIQREEQVRAEKKAKEDKLNMLKDLRNL